ncbi:MliC family protein [Dyella sp. ASV21]|jgi:membrane-bound inhibitor of C-type lysozyme|uniref:MliC family protein n=1 Tax=Dyella sp. ASV21 TaxID=2795114 RepID=UPI0018EDAD18|nr:MliC family protein [Dyella sp. ASV21]
MRLAPLLPLGLMLAVSACQSPQPPADTASAPAHPAAAPAPAAHVYAYQCGDLAVTGRFSAEQVELSFGGKTLVLPQAMAASGARYADDKGNEFWGKGLKDATFTLAGEPARTCSGSGEALPSP